MKSRPVRVGARLSVAAALVVLGVWPAEAGGTQETVRVGSLAEAWYEQPDTEAVAPLPEAPAVPDPCTLPVGCPPALPVPAPVPEVPAPAAVAYPANTLHVEAVGGQRTALAYLVPDLTMLPADATVRSGKLVLPVNEEPTSGNLNLAAVRLRACLTTEPVTDGATGSPSGAPAFDCKAATAPAVLDAKANHFEVDLAAFIAEWTSGAPNHGVALLPAADLAPESTWHLAINGSRVESGKGAVSVLRIQLPAPDPSPAPEPSPSLPLPPSGTGSIYTPPVVSVPATAPVPAGPVALEAPPAAISAAPFTLLSSPWYTYRGVVFLPLAFLISLGWTGRSLTRPLASRAR